MTNFFLNRLLVFQDKSAAGQSIWRYAVLAVVQASLSAVLVSASEDLTNATNLLETVIKIPVDGVLFLGKLTRSRSAGSSGSVPTRRINKKIPYVRRHTEFFYVSISILRKCAAPARASRPQR